MSDAYICAALRTPVGKHGGALAGVRADDLAAIPIGAIVERSGVDPATIDDVIFGCTNQAGEDNRNVARMALLLAGLPVTVPVKRSIGYAARGCRPWRAPRRRSKREKARRSSPGASRA